MLLIVLVAGTKFACSSGAKTIAVSRLDTSQGSDWYVSKLIKGHKSTVSESPRARRMVMKMIVRQSTTEVCSAYDYTQCGYNSAADALVMPASH